MTLSKPISFDRVAHLYDETRGLPRAVQDRLIDSLLDWLDGGPTLDVGTGTGRYSGPLARRGCTIVGVDVARQMIRRAVAAGLETAVLADARRLPFRDGAFRSALGVHIFHLVDDWPAVVREVARVTDGIFATVFEVETETPSITDEYTRRAAARGVPTDPPGLPERKLPARLVPDRQEQVEGLTRTVPAATLIGFLERRSFRNQWAVPDAIHGPIVDELRAEFAQREIVVDLKLTLAAWTTTRFATLADGTPR